MTAQHPRLNSGDSILASSVPAYLSLLGDEAAGNGDSNSGSLQLNMNTNKQAADLSLHIKPDSSVNGNLSTNITSSINHEKNTNDLLLPASTFNGNLSINSEARMVTEKKANDLLLPTSFGNTLPKSYTDPPKSAPSTINRNTQFSSSASPLSTTGSVSGSKLPSLSELYTNHNGSFARTTDDIERTTSRDRKYAVTTSILEQYRPNVVNRNNDLFNTANDDIHHENKRRAVSNRRSVTEQLPSYVALQQNQLMHPAYLDLAYNPMGQMFQRGADSVKGSGGLMNPSLFNQQQFFVGNNLEISSSGESRRGKRGKDHQKRKNRVCSFCAVKNCPNSKVCKGRGGRKYCDCCSADA